MLPISTWLQLQLAVGACCCASCGGFWFRSPGGDLVQHPAHAHPEELRGIVPRPRCLHTSCWLAERAAGTLQATA